MVQLLDKDEHGKYLLVSCGSANARFYVDLYRSDCALGKKLVKCVLHGSERITPGRLESMRGKGSTKNLKCTINFNKSPIYAVLGLSDVRTSPPVSSQSPKVDKSVQPDSEADPVKSLCNLILAFIEAYTMREEAASLKRALIENLFDVEFSGAMKALWNFCQGKLKSLSYTYHCRRAIHKRPIRDAVSEDLLLAFEKLDSVDFIPQSTVKQVICSSSR